MEKTSAKITLFNNNFNDFEVGDQEIINNSVLRLKLPPVMPGFGGKSAPRNYPGARLTHRYGTISPRICPGWFVI